MSDDKPQLLFTEHSTQHSLDHRRESPQRRPSKIAKVNDADEDLIDSEEEEEEGRRETVGMASQNPNKLQRYLVAVEYIGTRFCGAQQQLNARTVVGVLEDAFQKFIGQPVSIFCSSRTDAGVHALSNVCHVDVERISKRKPDESLPPHEPTVVKRAMNHFLQKNAGDIIVTDVRCVPADFHSRYKAEERTYFYRLLSGPEFLSSFEKDRAWHVPEELDLPAMQRACKVLVGCHDFSSFRAAACQMLISQQPSLMSIRDLLDLILQLISLIATEVPKAKSPLRTLDELSVTEVLPTPYFPSRRERETQTIVGEDPPVCSGSKTDGPHDSRQNNVAQFNVEASQGFGTGRRHRCFVVTARSRSFLYHQVRLLVGVLKAVGTGDLTIADVERILKAKTVTAASPMAPACGLYLGHVKYDLP